MKPIILLVSCLLLVNQVFSQMKTKEYFLEKSKKQKTTAWILLGAGAGAIITGAIMDNSHKGEEQSFTGGFVEIGGIISTLTGIPFLISSLINKRRAIKLTINTGKIILPQDKFLVSTNHFSLSAIIPLGH